MLLKPIWSYGIILGSAKPPNIKTIQFYQSISLRIIIKAPWFITNVAIHHSFKFQSVTETTSTFYKQFHSITNSPKSTDHLVQIDISTQQSCETSQTKLVQEPTLSTQNSSHTGFASVHFLEHALHVIKISILY